MLFRSRRPLSRLPLPPLPRWTRVSWWLSFPENAKVLFAEAEEAAKEKYDAYKRRAEK